jgi:hypothetical protein
VAGKRAETMLEMMLFIEMYTLNRAWDGLTDAELMWEPTDHRRDSHARALVVTSTPRAEPTLEGRFGTNTSHPRQRGA